MNAKTLLYLLIVCIGLSACSALEATPQTVEGFYRYGFETKALQPCGLDEMWWVRGGSTLLDQYSQVTHEPYEPAYVKVTGKKSLLPGQYGHTGAYAREFQIEEVIEVRKAEPGDCE